ncbi:MAG: CHASE2 domain-containing protein, partial [Deltaproteobacteria bacterium]
MQKSQRFSADLRFYLTGRIGALLLLVSLAAGMVVGDARLWSERVRTEVFDCYHQLSPRKRISQPVTIVAIDDQSLSALGQWPWPRTLLARLVNTIMAAKPAALGIDIIFPEPDRYSPGNIDQHVSRIPSELLSRLKQLPPNDDIFASALSGKPVVLGFAGMDNGRYGNSGGYTPFMVRGTEKELTSSFLRRFEGALHSINILEMAAAGRGFLSVDLENGIARRVPLVATIAGTLAPSFDLELLRVVTDASSVALETDRWGAAAVGVGDLRLPVGSDGRFWVYFSPHDAGRFVSARDILDGKIPTERLQNRLVLLAVTGIGMVDYPTSPLGEYIPGVEVHAQILENVFDNTFLTRPFFARYLETALLLLLGSVFIVMIPRIRPTPAIIGGVALIFVTVTLGFVLFCMKGILFDFVTPAVGTCLVFALLLWDGYKRTEEERRLIARQLAVEKEQAARLAGELEAASRIQLGFLPDMATALRGATNVDLYASMVPAREVGGDLYDFFILPGERLFFIVGDVSGKGLPASLFMAVSKVLCKSIAQQHSNSLEEMLSTANGLLTENNPELLFLTAFVGVLDLRTGELVYSNAGHDFPYII